MHASGRTDTEKNGILYSNGNEQTTSLHSNTGESQNCNVEPRNEIQAGHIILALWEAKVGGGSLEVRSLKTARLIW